MRTNQPTKVCIFRIGSTILGLHPGQVGAEDVGFGRRPACSSKRKKATIRRENAAALKPKLSSFMMCHIVYDL